LDRRGEIITMFGARRAMFGSNFPVDCLCGTFDAIRSVFKRIASRYPIEDQRLLFCDTARNVYHTGFQDEKGRGADAQTMRRYLGQFGATRGVKDKPMQA
jgi:hypothetical protein